MLELSLAKAGMQFQYISGAVNGLPCENLLCDLVFFSNSSGSDDPGSSKLSCKNTFCCRFCTAKWQIFKVGGLLAPHTTMIQAKEEIRKNEVVRMA